MKRRSFLKTSAASALAVPLIGCGESALLEASLSAGRVPEAGPEARHPPVLPDTLFQHGVASGDPTDRGIVLWTRISRADPAPVSVRWWIGTLEDGSAPLLEGTAEASAEADYTVKVILDEGLQPATSYCYGFEALGERSPVGRTRTFPGADARRLRIAAMTCSNLPTREEGEGTFAVYHRLAERDDLDLVLHLGDYIYEFGSGKFEPPRECRRLEDYRQRYAQYRRDPGLQRAHQQHPWIVMWDDHEVANEPWATGAEFHREDEHGPWQRRKEEATRAFWEWLPMRQPRPEPEKGWRRTTVGSLVDILVLDSRLHRSRWIAEERDRPFVTFEFDEIDDPERTKLGEEQEAWLEEQLGRSTATWRLFTTGVPIIPWKVPGLPQLPSETLRELGIRQLPLPVTQGGNALTLDKWDGYPEARRRLLRSLQQKGLNNNVAVSGDLHFVLSGEIPLDPFDPLVYDPITGRGSTMVEMVAPAVNSGNFEQALQGSVPQPLRSAVLTTLEQGSTLVNPHHVYTNFVDHGWLILDIRPERVRGEYWYLEGDRHRRDTPIRFAVALESPAAGTEPLTGPNRLRRSRQSSPELG